MTGLEKEFDSKAPEIIEKLKQAASILFTRDNLVITTTCSRKDLNTLNGELKKNAGRFSRRENPVEQLVIHIQ